MNESSQNAEELFQSLKILRTKINPPRVHPDCIDRVWLTRRLDEGIHSRLYLICAPPGYGKTMLAASWIKKQKFSSGWVSLDERDNDPARFWEYVIAALQSIQSGLGVNAVFMLKNPQPPPLESILTDLLNDLSGMEGEAVLVLDDYHVIHEPKIQEGVGFLLEHLPPQMHLMITSRVEPDLPLAQMRVRREMVQIGLPDLQFSLDEAREFFTTTMQLNLQPEDISVLEEFTEGWVAGLQLAALSVKDNHAVPESIRKFSGSHRYVFDYLAEEVLNRQPETLRQFLLQTSILEQFNAPLCKKVLGGEEDLQNIIESIEKANLLIFPLDSQRDWYRYHHLFSDFLHTRLSQEKTGVEIADLHRRASVWYEQNHFPGEAISHAIQGGDPMRAAALIRKNMYYMFANSELVTLLGWLDLLPAEVLNQDLTLMMMSVWAALATGRMDQTEKRLNEVEKALGTTSAEGLIIMESLSKEIKGALAEVSILRAIVSFQHFDISAVLTYCQNVLNYLTPDVEKGLFQSRLSILTVNTFNYAVALDMAGKISEADEQFGRSIVLCNQDNNFHLGLLATSHLGRIREAQGRLNEAVDLYQRAQKMMETTSFQPSPMVGIAYVGVGNIFCERNDLKQAESILTYGVDLGKRWANWESLIPGYLGLARVRLARKDFEGAVTLTDVLVQLTERFHGEWLANGFSHIRMEILAKAGRRKEVETWLESVMQEAYTPPNVINESEMIALVQILIDFRKIEPAETLLNHLVEEALAGERNGSLIGILTLNAILQSIKGNRTKAVDLLIRALTIAEPEGYFRIFVDHGTDLIELLDNIPEGSRVKGYASRLSQSIKEEACEAQPAAASESLPKIERENVLSEREMDVLNLLSEGLSNQEIADRLVVSLNTVKTHIKNILLQLDVHNRTRAVSRARELGLIK